MGFCWCNCQTNPGPRNKVQHSVGGIVGRRICKNPLRRWIHNSSTRRPCGFLSWRFADALATTTTTGQDGWQLGWTGTSSTTRRNNAVVGYGSNADSSEDQSGPGMFQSRVFSSRFGRNSYLFFPGDLGHAPQGFFWTELLGRFQ